MKLVVLMAAGMAGGLLWAWRGATPEGKAIAMKHRQVMAETSPLAAVAWGVALALGWAARARLRKGTGHASPTAAWAGKRATAASTVVVAIYAFSPVAWPLLAIYAALAAGAVGAGIYAANLPLHL